MLDNGNDQCWVKYLRWVKFHKNTSYNSFEAVYNKKPSFGLSHLGIAHEFWGSIDTEEDLIVFHREVSGPAAARVANPTGIGHSLPEISKSIPGDFL